MRCLALLFCGVVWASTGILDRYLLEMEGGDRFSCEKMAGVPITWTSPLGACGLDSRTYFNQMGNSTMTSYLQCLIKGIGKPFKNVGIAYPGSCGCPIFCNNATLQGNCIENQCQCNSGWEGVDCSQSKLFYPSPREPFSPTPESRQ